jgi:hypothetical protein
VGAGSEQRPSGIGQGGIFEAASGDLEVHLGGGQIDVAQEALDLGEGGAGVDEEGGVGVAQGVDQRSRRRDDAGAAVRL